MKIVGRLLAFKSSMIIHNSICKSHAKFLASLLIRLHFTVWASRQKVEDTWELERLELSFSPRESQRLNINANALLVNNYTFFFKRPVYKRHEPEIYQNFKNKIRDSQG